MEQGVKSGFGELCEQEPSGVNGFLHRVSSRVQYSWGPRITIRILVGIGPNLGGCRQTPTAENLTFERGLQFRKRANQKFRKLKISGFLSLTFALEGGGVVIRRSWRTGGQLSLFGLRLGMPCPEPSVDPHF